MVPTFSSFWELDLKYYFTIKSLEEVTWNVLLRNETNCGSHSGGKYLVAKVSNYDTLLCYVP